LALEIVFLSVLFAVIANIRWRRRGVYLVVTCLGVAAIAGGIIGLVRLREAAVEGAVPRARSDERYADRLLRSASSSTAWIPPEVRQENLENAKLYLRHAAENWHIAGNTAEEQRVRAKEKNVEKPPSASAFLGSPPPSRDQGMRGSLPPEVEFS